MADLTASGTPLLTTSDGRAAEVGAGRGAGRRPQRRAFLLVLPLLLFVVLTFILPIGQMLYRSVHNDGFSANMPELARLVRRQPGRNRARRGRLRRARRRSRRPRPRAKTVGVVGTRINYDVSGTRSLFTATARKADDAGAALPRGDARARRRNGAIPSSGQRCAPRRRPIRPNFYLAALDLTHDETGAIVRVPEDRAHLLSCCSCGPLRCRR